MAARRNPVLNLAIAHTAIIFVVLHVLGGTVYFHVLPSTKNGLAVSHAERIVKDLVSDLEEPTTEALEEFFREKRTVHVRIVRPGGEVFTNSPAFFSRHDLPLSIDGPFAYRDEADVYQAYNTTPGDPPLAGHRVQIVRESIFIRNALIDVVIRYEFLVVLICLILFYVFLSVSHVQLRRQRVDDALIEEELNAASLFNALIVITLLVLTAVSYYREGLTYALFHQMDGLLRTVMEDSHPLVNLLILVLLVMVEVVTGAMPGAVLYPTAGILFGTELGSLGILIGTVVGSGIGYLQGRTISMTFHESETQAAEFSDYIKKQGSLGIFILRVNPITSFSFINQVAGVLRVPFPGFLLATTTGRLPVILLGTFLGRHVFDRYKGAMAIILSLLVLYLLYLIVRRATDAGRWQRKYLQLYVTNINKMGAAAQSSDFLARKMTEHLPLAGAGSVLELGPGTGVFTERLIELKDPGTRVVTIEANDMLARHMRETFPGVVTVHGDARDIRRHLSLLGLEVVDIVVSGLPFLSMPQYVTEKILDEIRAVLDPAGTFVLFQYTLILLPQIKARFRVEKITWTPFNVPPAFVLTCRPGRSALEGAVTESRLRPLSR